LVLWRHGVSTWNVERRIQGQLDPPLADEGLRQAEKAAEALACLQPAVLATSDLVRARLTAQALAVRTGLSVQVDPRLRERHWGSWQGRTHADLAVEDAERYAAWRAGRRIEVPGREPVESVQARAVAAVLAVVTSAPAGSTVVVTSHGGTIGYAIAGLIGLGVDFARAVRGLDNARWAELRPHHDRWRLRAYNVGAEMP